MTKITADTFLIYSDDGYLYHYLGTKDQVNEFVAGGGNNLTQAPKIGTDRQWDNYNNGGPHPVAAWLRKHPEIKFIMDQDYADPFGSTEFWDVKDWIEGASN